MGRTSTQARRLRRRAGRRHTTAETLAADTLPAGTRPANPPAADALLPLAGLVRSVSTPEFAGITFHEVTAKSVLNKVVAGSRMPFEWTINPYRGCSHACVYCFARKSHTYLDFDAGLDFDSQVVVKINAAEVLRRELAKPSWRHEHVALGTNTDPYQRAEGRYRLMPGIIGALADSGTPLSILTKGDAPGPRHPAPEACCRPGASRRGNFAGHDQRAAVRSRRTRHTGSAGAAEAHSRLREAGLPCGVMAMPILPWLSDSDDALDSLFGALAAAGATGVTAGALYLKPGTREWFMQWIAREHPQLAGKYRRLYGSGSYASKEYRAWLAGRIRYFKDRHGFSGRTASATGTSTDDAREEEAQYPAGSIPDTAAHAAAVPGAASHAGHASQQSPAQPTLLLRDPEGA